MEQKLVRVPFEVELAKKIANGEVDGRIVTKKGDNVRIVCFDVKGKAPILGLIDKEDREGFQCYDERGKVPAYEYNELDLMLEIPEYMTFRDGDVLIDDADMPFIYNGKKDEQWGYGYICGLNYNKLLSINENIGESRWTYIVKRRATETEKQELIEALKASKEPKAKEYLKRFFGVEQKQEYEFKLFDKVLVKDHDEDSEWRCGLFSHKNEDGLYICVGSIYEQCIPYEGNEHLLGTTDKMEEK